MACSHLYTSPDTSAPRVGGMILESLAAAGNYRRLGENCSRVVPHPAGRSRTDSSGQCRKQNRLGCSGGFPPFGTACLSNYCCNIPHRRCELYYVNISCVVDAHLGRGCVRVRLGNSTCRAVLCMQKFKYPFSADLHILCIGINC